MKWEKSKVPPDRRSIEQVERKFGIEFPFDYREIAMISHGTSPTPYTIDFGNFKEKVFGNLLSFRRVPRSILKEYMVG